MGLMPTTEGKMHQTEMYTPSLQCVEANGVGVRVSNDEKWTNESAAG